MYCGTAFAGSRGAALSLLFFCRRFLFQIKRKCRNAENIEYLIVVGREGRVQIPQIHIVTLARQRVVESPTPTKYAAIKLHSFRGRILFAPTRLCYFVILCNYLSPPFTSATPIYICVHLANAITKPTATEISCGRSLFFCFILLSSCPLLSSPCR